MNKTHKVKLTKIKSNHDNLRTDEIEGETLELPEKGKSFQIYAPGLVHGIRMVTTTEIQFVEKLGNVYHFNTLNSIYQVVVLDDTSLKTS